jgi:steroid delta-isomerase-like uncharacterized protein
MNGIDANKDVVRRFIDRVLANGSTDAVDELVADDFVSHTWGITGDGRAKLRATTERVHSTLSDVRFTVEEIIGEGDLVAVRLTSSATPTAEFMGVPASGKGYTIGEMHFFRVRDGRIVEHWHQHDAAGLLKQLSTD